MGKINKYLITGQLLVLSVIVHSLTGYKEIVELLIKHGADVNAVDKKGTTALIEATPGGYNEIVEMLLKAGANIEHKDNMNITASYLAQVQWSWEREKNINKQAIDKMLEDEPARRKPIVEKWIEDKFAKEITELTGYQLIPDISNIIAQYAIEYIDLPLAIRLGLEENKEMTKCCIIS